MKVSVQARAALASFAVLLGAAGSVHASVEPRWSVLQLAGFANVILTGRVVDIRSGTDPAVNSIYTYVTVDVSRVSKGLVNDRQVVVKQLGGQREDRGLRVPGQAEFTLGEDVLLFLEARPRDGSLYTEALWQGKWSIETINGVLSAVQQQYGTDPRVSVALEFVQELVSRLPPADQDRGAVAVDLHPADADAAIARPYAIFSPSFRYNFSPAVDVQSGGYPGLAGGGFAEIQASINRWNSAGSGFAYAAGSTAGPARCFNQELGNSRVTISFNDPCNEIADGGGTLAFGGSYYSTSGGNTVNGQFFFPATEGFVVSNNDSITANLMRQSGCFADIHLHELGHVLGLDHTADRNAIMFATIDNGCSTGAHGLGADDIRGLLFVYPPTTSTTPPTSAPTSVSVAVHGSTSITVSFIGVTSDVRFEAAAATSYRLDFRPAPTGPVLASATSASTAVTVGVPAGMTGTFHVTVTGINSAGAGPSSAPVAFTIPGGCAPPATPTGLTGRFVGGVASATWNASAGATSYIVQAGTVAGASNLANVNIGNATGASASGLPAGFQAYVRVVAVNACGQSAPTGDFLIQ